MRVAGGVAPEWHASLGAVQAAVPVLQLDIAGGHNTVMSRLNAGGFMVGFYSQCPDCLIPGSKNFQKKGRKFLVSPSALVLVACNVNIINHLIQALWQK